MESRFRKRRREKKEIRRYEENALYRFQLEWRRILLGALPTATWIYLSVRRDETSQFLQKHSNPRSYSSALCIYIVSRSALWKLNLIYFVNKICTYGVRKGKEHRSEESVEKVFKLPNSFDARFYEEKKQRETFTSGDILTHTVILSILNRYFSYRNIEVIYRSEA